MQLALLCMQFADSASNIAAGALIQINLLFFLHFHNFSSVLERSWKVKIVCLCLAITNTYLKGLVSSFCFNSKRYQIPFCNLQKGNRAPHTKLGKIREIKGYCKRLSNILLQLAIGSLITYRAIAKGYQTPFRASSMRNPRIACKADNVCNIPLGEFNLNFKKWGKV